MVTGSLEFTAGDRRVAYKSPSPEIQMAEEEQASANMSGLGTTLRQEVQLPNSSVPPLNINASLPNTVLQIILTLIVILPPLPHNKSSFLLLIHSHIKTTLKQLVIKGFINQLTPTHTMSTTHNRSILIQKLSSLNLMELTQKGWVNKAEQYFDFITMEDAKRVKLYGLHFEGKASIWF